MKKNTTTFVACLAMLALVSPLYAGDEEKMNTDNQPKAGTTQYQEGMRAGTSPSAPGQQPRASQSQSAKGIKGYEVYSQAGEEIGKITEVRTDKQSGEVQFVTLTKGGVVGIGGKDIALPLRAFKLDREKERATLTVSEAMLENAPTQADKSDQDFQRELSSHYGIAPDWDDTKTGGSHMDQSQNTVPAPAPALETGSPAMRDNSKKMD
ncbi:MAG: hypothetical protein VR65_20090 [Desulfobulbaceae bacterium BRH_c16a]|nr:MAG: hypothetical protein VR65_20090 [Desulfobulbaceae bacterium BRH_c16a]